jgi:hypothetical protein
VQGDLVESRDESGDHLFDPHEQDHVIHAISELQEHLKQLRQWGGWMNSSALMSLR